MMNLNPYAPPKSPPDKKPIRKLAGKHRFNRYRLFLLSWIAISWGVAELQSHFEEEIIFFYTWAGIHPSWGLRFFVGEHGDFASQPFACIVIGLFLSVCLSYFFYKVFPPKAAKSP